MVCGNKSSFRFDCHLAEHANRILVLCTSARLD